MQAHEAELVERRVNDGEWVMQVLSSTQLGALEAALFLRVFDVDFLPNPERVVYPCGFASLTSDLDDAYRWPTQEAAWASYMTVCGPVPTRPDGKPNRPLAAYTVLVVRASAVTS